VSRQGSETILESIADVHAIDDRELVKTVATMPYSQTQGAEMIPDLTTGEMA